MEALNPLLVTDPGWDIQTERIVVVWGTREGSKETACHVESGLEADRATTAEPDTDSEGCVGPAGQRHGGWRELGKFPK